MSVYRRLPTQRIRDGLRTMRARHTAVAPRRIFLPAGGGLERAGERYPPVTDSDRQPVTKRLRRRRDEPGPAVAGPRPAKRPEGAQGRQSQAGGGGHSFRREGGQGGQREGRESSCPRLGHRSRTEGGGRHGRDRDRIRLLLRAVSSRRFILSEELADSRRMACRRNGPCRHFSVHKY